MSLQCESCGTGNPERSQFCFECGSSLRLAKSSPQESTPPSYSQQPNSYHHQPPQQQSQYASPQYQPPSKSKRLYRSRTNRVFGGVCAGIAYNTNSDPNAIRLLAILAAVFTGGAAFFAYIVAWLAVPKEPYPHSIEQDGYQSRY